MATAGTAEQPEVLYTSPGGAIRIERNGEKVWVISTKDPAQRAELPPLEGVSSFDDEFHSSPNDEWIFGTRKMAHGFSNGDVFHRIDPQHIKIAPTEQDQSFNDLVWPYCVKQGALKANYSAEEDGADVGMTDSWRGVSIRAGSWCNCVAATVIERCIHATSISTRARRASR